MKTRETKHATAAASRPDVKIHASLVEKHTAWQNYLAAHLLACANVHSTKEWSHAYMLHSDKTCASKMLFRYLS